MESNCCMFNFLGLPNLSFCKLYRNIQIMEGTILRGSLVTFVQRSLLLDHNKHDHDKEVLSSGGNVRFLLTRALSMTSADCL